MRIRSRSLIGLVLALLWFGLAYHPAASLAILSPDSVYPASEGIIVPARFPSTFPLYASPSAQVATERIIRVDALFVIDSTPKKGTTAPEEIRVRNASVPGQLRVGFLEGEVGGTGAQWRAAGWTAVLVASMAIGIDPTNYEFEFSVGGHTDGPSGGALMTVAVLAGLRGDTPRPDATMTGTINPDGTIGPVGGIPHKIQGAAARGKKLVLVPLGQRLDKDLNTNQMVDVVAEGRGLGVDVREVGNVFDAYALLVGKPLPRPITALGVPQFPMAAFNRIKDKVNAWYERYSLQVAQFNGFDNATKKILADDAQNANRLALRSIEDYNQGLIGLAYFEITDATLRLQRANVNGNLRVRYNTNGLNAAIDYLATVAQVESDLDTALVQLQQRRPATVSDVVALFDTYSNFGAAEGLLIGVTERISALKGDLSKLSQDEILSTMRDIADDMIGASNYITMGQDAIYFESGVGTTPAPNPALVVGVAETLRRASDANMAMFDSTTIADNAPTMKMTPDAFKSWLAGKDAVYRTTVLTPLGQDALLKRMRFSDMHSAALIFGNSQNYYANTSEMIAKYYSLDAQWDQNFQVTSFSNTKPLTEMVNLADQRLRDLIALCGTDVPVPAILYYENAHLLRQSSPNDQMIALNYYWQGYVLAQAEAFMTGKLRAR